MQSWSSCADDDLVAEVAFMMGTHSKQEFQDTRKVALTESIRLL